MTNHRNMTTKTLVLPSSTLFGNQPHPCEGSHTFEHCPSGALAAVQCFGTHAYQNYANQHEEKRQRILEATGTVCGEKGFEQPLFEGARFLSEGAVPNALSARSGRLAGSPASWKS